MALTDGYMTIPQVVEWLTEQGYAIGRPTLRLACLKASRGDATGLPCETAISGKTITYYVRPDDALAYARRKYTVQDKRKPGRPMGTVGIAQKKK